MKRKTAKEILAESFRELAQTRPADKITIQEIASNCGYSPATFYRNFSDKYDLIAWEYARGTEKIMARALSPDYPWKQTLLYGVSRFEQEKEYLTNLFLHTGGHDAFIRYMTDINCSALKKHILAVSGSSDTDSLTDLYIRIYCLGTVNLSCEWILGTYDITPEELAEIFENSLPEPLKTVLLRK